jgi:hypothetical protein
MTNIFVFIGILIVTEIVLAFIFASISQVFYQKLGLDFKSILKGIIERMFLFISF